MKRSYIVGLVLICCYLVAWLDRMAINLTLPYLSADLQIGPEQQGWVLSAFFLGYACFQIPGGMLADRFGPRRVILAALAWWSVFTVLTGRAASLPIMLATRFSFGVGEGVFPASVWKTIAGWFTRRNRATANALVLSAIALGPALTPLVVAPVIANFGWRACFTLLGACGVLCWGLAALFLRDSIHADPAVSAAELKRYETESRSEAATGEASLEPARAIDLARSPTVWVLFTFVLLYNVTMYGWLNWLPSYLMKVKGLDLKATALAASLPFAFAAVGCMAAGWVSDRWFRGQRRLLVLGCMVLGGFCLYLFTSVADWTSYMIFQCLAGFLLFMAVGAVWTLPMILLPPRLMGTGSGFINTGGQIGGFITNVLIGYYIAWRGGDYAAGFDVMLGALVLAALLLLVGVREGPRRAEAAALVGA